ncbi:hypothetical protein RAN3_1199 [plant metagenome]|uniref:Uncharacterized protein n=1 Tax=plant metagenome TaxID=1297885 RepID=A0A484V1I6_9ZZZZ
MTDGGGGRHGLPGCHCRCSKGKYGVFLAVRSVEMSRDSSRPWYSSTSAADPAGEAMAPIIMRLVGAFVG